MPLIKIYNLLETNFPMLPNNKSIFKQNILAYIMHFKYNLLKSKGKMVIKRKD